MGVIRESKKLKDTKIWIGEGYSKTVLETQKKLTTFLKEARSKGYQARIIFDRLVINNET